MLARLEGDSGESAGRLIGFGLNAVDIDVPALVIRYRQKECRALLGRGYLTVKGRISEGSDIESLFLKLRHDLLEELVVEVPEIVGSVRDI